VSRRWRDLPSHHAWLDAETRRLLAFARNARLERGFGWMGATGAVLAGQPQPLWITARLTHVFALGELLGEPGSASLCDHGLRALLEDFADRDHDGWFAELSAGRPSRTGKEAYSFAFVALAFSSAVIADHASARDGLVRVLDLIQRHFWLEDEGACCEAYDRTWHEREAYRGANANMHMVEAFLAAADALDDPIWVQRALRIAERVINQQARANDWRVPEHFDDAWTAVPDYNTGARDHPFRPFGFTPGHGLEWARLLVSLHAKLQQPPGWLLRAAEALFDRAVQDGWVHPGGFVYTTDANGTPVVSRRFHWVVAEGIAAAAALNEATGDARFEAWYRRCWDFADLHLRDRMHGSWHHELDDSLTPIERTWPGKPDIYHALQATLISRLPLSGSVAGGLRGGLR
jgi:mannose/cellobiose epimerase-like protein (N-acyl-D-glucosamine 2-epimerase family)